MYTWDGKFMSTVDVWAPGLSHDGRYYITQDGQIWSAAGVLTGTDPQWGHFPSSWAGDGDYLCAFDESTLWVTAITGQTNAYPIANGENPISLYGCSINTKRAAILEPVPASSSISVVSLESGDVITLVHLAAQMQAVVVSADVRWMAESLTTGETDIIDLSDGTTKARFAHASIDNFLPDGYVMTLNDSSGPAARLVNWQTGQQLWTAPGHIKQTVVSDVATDRVWVWVTTATAQGPDTYDYEILDARGTSLRFQPQP